MSGPEPSQLEIIAKLRKKLYNWWRQLSIGNIIIIYKDNTYKLVKSSMKTTKAQINDIVKKWEEFNNDSDVKAIIWSAQSTDVLDLFIEYLIKKKLPIKNLPEYLIENYKKYFRKCKINSSKDYTFKA